MLEENDEKSKEKMEEVRGQRGIAPAPWGVGSPSLLPPANRNATTAACAWGGGRARRSTSLLGTEMPGVLFSLGIEKTDKFKPTTSRPPALHLQPYSSVSVWRGTEGGGVDAHRKRHLNQDYLTCGNKRKGAYGCCLDLMTCLAKH